MSPFLANHKFGSNFFTLCSSIAKRENIWFNNPGIKAAKFHFRNRTTDNESHTL